MQVFLAGRCKLALYRYPFDPYLWEKHQSGEIGQVSTGVAYMRDRPLDGYDDPVWRSSTQVLVHEKLHDRCDEREGAYAPNSNASA